MEGQVRGRRNIRWLVTSSITTLGSCIVICHHSASTPSCFPLVGMAAHSQQESKWSLDRPWLAQLTLSQPPELFSSHPLLHIWQLQLSSAKSSQLVESMEH